MGKTTVEQGANKYVVENRLTNAEAINERELNAIAAQLFDRLIPVQTEKSKKGVVVKGTITGMLTLSSYMSGLVSKKMFLDSIIQIVAVLKECEKNLMNVNNLMLDWDYIFVDPRTKKIKCIFWPIVNNQNPIIPSEFLKEIPFRLVFTKHEDLDYVAKYVRYFRNNASFSINSFEKLILELMGKAVGRKSHEPSGSISYGNADLISTVLEETQGDAGNIAYNPLSHVSGQKTCPNCGQVSLESAKFCPACGAPLTTVQAQEKLDISEVLGLNETEVFSETAVLGKEDIGGTTVLGADAFKEHNFPYLLREKTQEKIKVDKTSFRIGKEARYCDYCVTNNAVSRSHADIITKDHRYYIVDKNSTNKTYVDGRVIPAQKEVEIFSGTKLRLANEGFVFYI